MFPSKSNFLWQLSDVEIFTCLKFTKRLLNDKSDELINEFFEMTGITDLKFREMSSELNQEEKRIHILKMYLGYLTEFNWRFRN